LCTTHEKTLSLGAAALSHQNDATWVLQSRFRRSESDQHYRIDLNQYESSRWWSGAVVSALASMSEFNERRARLVLRLVTVSGFTSRCGTFISVCDQPGQLSLAIPSWVGATSTSQRAVIRIAAGKK